MNTRSHSANRLANRRAGFALVIVMVLIGISLSALVGAMSWTATNSRQTVRNGLHATTVEAAEAATEKVLTRLLSDYQKFGESEVYNNLDAYAQLVPKTSECSFWSDYTFTDGTSASNRVFITRTQAQVYKSLDSQYEGLKGWASTYRIIANASRVDNHGGVVKAAVAQDVQTASIPVFQFAIFYGLDLELHSMTVMDIIGRVHSNRDIYTYPSQTTTFWQDVTAAGTFYKTRKPGDPDYSTAPASGKTIFKGKKDAQVATLNLPIGTNNTITAVREVLNMPSASEDMDSAMGKQRYYNKAELVIIVTNNAVTAFAKEPFSTDTYPINWSSLSTLVSTNATFTDQREGKTIKATEINVSKIQSWSVTNSSVASAIGSSKPVNLIYVADNRKVSSSQLTAVRLINGQTLPNRGLTVATPNPLYVKGHYNQPTSKYLGTTNTTTTEPASLVSDALTILSSAWNDSKSGNSYTSRDAVDTTVNAAILTGIVETSKSSHIYSGGAHNLGRFLEDWSNRTFTYNGSMVVLFNSVKATAPFEQPGDYYDPPERDFSFDLNFLDGTKLPPGTPDVRVVIRTHWATVAPGKTDFDSDLRPL
jgi:hypothetical protein